MPCSCGSGKQVRLHSPCTTGFLAWRHASMRHPPVLYSLCCAPVPVRKSLFWRGPAIHLQMQDILRTNEQWSERWHLNALHCASFLSSNSSSGSFPLLLIATCTRQSLTCGGGGRLLAALPNHCRPRFHLIVF